jgi:hypothetical protein
MKVKFKRLFEQVTSRDSECRIKVIAGGHDEERFLCDVNSKLDVVVPHRINIIKSPGSTSFAGFLYCTTNINIATA